MAIHYPYLYELKAKFNKMITDTIITSIQNNYFLHFAGSWHESEMWKNKELKKEYFGSKTLKKLIEFQKVKLKGKPKGMLKPTK